MVNDDDMQSVPRVRDLLTLGGMFVGAVVAGVAIGLFVDVRLGSAPTGVIVGTALGIVAAAVGFWLRVRSFLRG